MSMKRKGAVLTSAAALLLATAAPSSAASYQYWYGELSMDATGRSGSYSSTGGHTSLGATGHYARNQSAQYGYAYAQATAYRTVTLSHARRSNTNNWCSWTTGGPYVSGKVVVIGNVHY